LLCLAHVFMNNPGWGDAPMQVEVRTATGVLALLALAACSATSNPSGAEGGDPPAAPPPREATAEERTVDPPVASVDGSPIHTSALLGAWMHADPAAVRSFLDGLVAERAVELEARRLAVELDPERVAEAQAQAIERLAADVAERYGEVTLDEWISAAQGLDPGAYRARVEHEVVRGLLAERVVRAFVLGSEHAIVRLAVTETRDAAERIRTAVEAGASFDEASRGLSIAPQASFGGLSPVVKSRTPLSRMAFATGVGELAGPFEEQGRWMLLRVESRAGANSGLWPHISAEVEASLAERAVSEPEYLQWTAEMARRYPIDLAPFFTLIEADDG
jgi:hypothetical protein